MVLGPSFDIPPLNIESGGLVGPYRIISGLFVASIDTTGGTVFPLKRPAKNQYELKYVAGADGLIAVPTATLVAADLGTNYSLLSIRYRIPTGLVATNGNALKVATAVNVSAASQVSTAAASTTYAAQRVAATLPFVNDGTAVGDLGAKNGNVTLSLYSQTATGTNTTGSSVAAASGIVYVPVIVTVAATNPNVLPEIGEIPGLAGRFE